jgi:O-antigen ligase
VLAFILYLKPAARVDQTGNTPVRPDNFSLAWTVFLSLGCILTASRGAFAALLGGMAALLFWGTRGQTTSRLKDLVAVSGVLLAMLLFMTVATDFEPWQTLQTRLDNGESVITASGRTEIWKHAFEMWISNPQYLLVGTGTGAVPESLGEYLGLTHRYDESVPRALDTHNTFVEWGLTFGLLGMTAGICLLVAVWRKAQELDRRDGSANRRAILICFALRSMTCVTYYQVYVMAAGGLMLAMLSEPLTAASSARSAHPAIPRVPSPQGAPLAVFGRRGRAHRITPPDRLTLESRSP